MAVIKKSKLNIPMTLGLALLCLTLVSMHFTGGLYARYTTNSTSGDSARVAGFDVADLIKQGENEIKVGDPIYLVDFKPGDSITYDIKLTNSSEVAVQYTISYTTTGNLPLEYSEISGTMPAKTDGQVESDIEYIIKWDSTKNDISHIGKIDVIQIIVKIEQID